jgi:hypothetical protein
MYAAAKSGEQKEFVSYSRGTIVARNALVRTHARLYTEYFVEAVRNGDSPLQAHRRADRQANADMQNIHLVTAASAAWAWPPYANVEHVSNATDPIPTFLGQTALSDPYELVFELFGVEIQGLPTRRDQDVVVESPNDGSGIGHSFTGTYLEHVVETLD